MSGSLNLCQFIGNLGADPEVRSTNSGGRVCNMRIACSESWKDRTTQEKRERTEWVNIVIWSDGLVGVAQSYLKKGSKIYIAGKMQTRKWTDQNGTDRYTTEIVLQGPEAKLLMLDGRPQGGDRAGDNYGNSGDRSGGGQFGGGSMSGSRPQPASFDSDLDDDVPF